MLEIIALAINAWAVTVIMFMAVMTILLDLK